MKKRHLLKTLLLLFALIVGSSSVWAEDYTYTIGWGAATGDAVPYTNFTATSGTVSGILSFSTAKNSSSSNPAYNTNSSELRLYYASSGDGGSITLTPAEGVTITGFVMTTSTAPAVNYTVDNGSAISVNVSNNTYTVTDISASSSLTIQNVNTSNTQLRIKTIEITYTSSGTIIPTCATPTFNPASGSVASETEVTISTETSGATIYYTMGSNPADPTTSSTKYESPITITEATTIKAIAVKDDYNNSEVASAEYTIKEAVSGYEIDFESDIDSYSDWTFTNVVTTNTAITAHGGNKYGANVNASGNGTETCIIQTKEKVANPGTLTFWISKTSNNTTASSWYVEVSEDGTSWTQVGDAQSAAEMTKGEWTKVERDMTDYSNVYVRIRYGSSSAIRTIDDISLTMSDPNQPSISAENVSLVYDATSGEIPYTINNPVAGTTLTATTTAEWISNFTVASDKVTFTATANDGAERTATVTLIYGNLTKEVTVSQAANPNAPGTENKPYTVAEARAAIDAGTGVTEVYATGIVSEIVTAYSDKFGNVTFDMVDENGTTVSLRAYRCTGDKAAEVAVGDVVVVKGNLTKYNSTYEFEQGCKIVSLQHSMTPSITVASTSVEVSANGGEGTIEVTLNNITEGVAAVKFYQADGTTETTYNWVTAEVNSDNNNVNYTISANDGEARTAYMKVYVNDVYSDLITITQAAPVNDYAELPFEFDGGSSDIESTSGLSAEGLGSDYNNSPKLKFDGTGDYLLLQFNETPGTLTFDIKGNNFSGGTFTVQTSVDGVTFTDLESYTELGATQSEKFDNLAADVRYIKWIYTEKINGNVALGNIKLAKPDNTPSISVASTSAEVDADGGDGVIAVTYKNVDAEGVEVKWVESDGTTAAEYDWILADLENDNNLYYVVTPNDGAERKAYLKLCFDAETNEVCSDLITITQAAYEAPYEGATYTLASTITPGKHYIIASEADDEGNAYAMGGQNPNNRAAVAIKVEGDKAQVNSADVREFVISIPADDGLYAIFDEAEGGYLYAASSGSNYLKTEETLDDNGKWTIAFNDEGDATIKAQGTNTHCWMQYNSLSTLFACYLEDKPQADVYLYEKDEDKTTVVTISELGYATFGSAEAVDFSEETNLTVYTAKVNDTNSEVELTEVSSKTVPAGEAVLLKGAAGTYTGKVIESTDRLTDNDLKLATADLRGNGKIYVLNKVDDKVGFYKLSAEGTLSKGKAYLESESAAPFLGFDGEDTTGINSVERGALSVEGCYTLDGRRVAQPTKGLYIVNGKKVVIK